MHLLILAAIAAVGYVLGTNLSAGDPKVAAAVLAFVGIIASFSKPFAVLMLLLVLSPFHGMARAYFLSPTTALWKEFLAVCLTVGWLARQIVHRQKMKANALNMPIALFTGITIIHGFTSPTLLQGLYELKKTVPFIPIFFFVANNPMSKPQLKRVITALLVVGTLTALIGIVQWVLGGPWLLRHNLMYVGRNVAFPASTFLRAWSTYGGPGFFAANLLVYLYIATALFVSPSHETRRNRMLFAMVLLFTALVFTMSRGPVMLYGIGLLALSHYSGRKSPLLLVALATLAIVAVFPAAVRERAAMSFGQQDTSWQFRIWFLTNVGIPDMIKHPLGAGLGTTRGFNYGVVSGLADVTGFTGEFERLEGGTENGYLHIGIQMGFPGLALFVWIFLAFFATGFGIYRRLKDPYLRAIALAALAVNLEVTVGNMLGVAFDAFPLDLYYWFLAGILVSLPEVEAAMERSQTPAVGAPVVPQT
ncbi:MAG: O-antigen ligase family protein [Candidatus Eisenbacteria bacterium]|nr:O-antigen ligase family protein [Candidatus Eisenbacteria bacterium]